MHALGCVGRAKQAIVVGDDRQLPPPAGLAGLLDDCLRANMLLQPLEVHYRSASTTLIQVSNALFYFGRLRSLPTAHDFILSTPRAAPLALLGVAARGLVRERRLE